MSVRVKYRSDARKAWYNCLIRFLTPLIFQENTYFSLFQKTEEQQVFTRAEPTF